MTETVEGIAINHNSATVLVLPLFKIKTGNNQRRTNHISAKTREVNSDKRRRRTEALLLGREAEVDPGLEIGRN